MRTLLSIVGAAYETPEAYARECDDIGTAARVVQNEGVARSCANAIVGGGLAVFLAMDVARDACPACLAAFECFRCGGTGKLAWRKSKCPHCAGTGECAAGTGGWVTLETPHLRTVPYVAWLHEHRRDGLARAMRMCERCEVCAGTGKRHRFEVFAVMNVDRVEVVDAARLPWWFEDTWDMPDAVIGKDRADLAFENRLSGWRRSGFWLVADEKKASLSRFGRAMEGVEWQLPDARVGPLWLLDGERRIYDGRPFRGVKDWKISDGRTGRLEGTRGAADSDGAQTPPRQGAADSEGRR